MAKFVDANGKPQEFQLGDHSSGNPMYHYRAAAAKGVSMRQYINSLCSTEPGKPDAFKQMCMYAGLRFQKDDIHGIPATNLLEIFDPVATNQTGGGHSNYPTIPDSKWLFPPALMEAVNAAMETRENEAMGAFSELLAFTDNIASDRFDQPVISFDGKKGPQDSAYRRTAQNAPPPLMLTITASEHTRTIPTSSIGLSISHKALANNNLDMVARTLVEFEKKATFTEWVTWLGLILAGDPDATNTPMATSQSALAQVKANTLDTTIIAAGEITQKAYLAWLYSNPLSLDITHVVTDMAAVQALNDRAGKPVMLGQENKADILNVPFEVIYPRRASTLKVLAMPAGTWTANTLMGIDKSAAIARVISSVADYEAMQDNLINRNTMFRYDRGSMLYRYRDAAHSVLSLTL